MPSTVHLLTLLPTAISAYSYLNTQCPGGLICHHGGQCSTGDKVSSERYALSADLPWTEQLNVNNEHCTDCHDGWGGVDCSRKYEICDENDPDSPTCFNGGECFKMGIDRDTGKYDYMCDCSAATALTGGKFHYAGEFCQHIEEMKCDDEMFCTNGGECVAVLGTDGQYSQHICECPSGRSGTHCEFLAEDDLADCSLECERGVCAKGFKSYDYLLGSGAFPPELALDLISDSGEHCVCPKGWTGLTCEIEVNRCGASKYCYHGSTCFYDSMGNPTCDCNSAHTDDISYAGASCEHKSTSFCTPGDDQDQKDSFCTNGGTCIEDPDTKHEGCICEDGFSGDQCEIKADVEPECTLDCKNGGSCRFGVKGIKDSVDSLGLAVFQTKEVNGMYCSCPSGFTGVQCEEDINHCHVSGTEEDHFCLNGTPCNSEDPNLKGVTKQYNCKCNDSKDEISQMLAGRFCEYKVTEFCFEEGASGGSHSFCTNGGMCKNKNKYGDHEHHGCCCPDGYEGDFCQFPRGTLKESELIYWTPLEECNKKPSETASHNTVVESVELIEEEILESEEANAKARASAQSSKKSKSAAVLSTLLVVVMVGGVVGVIYMKRDQKERDTHEYDADAVWPPPGSNLAPMGRTWSYPASHSLSSDANWEYSNKHGDLHDVAIS